LSTELSAAFEARYSQPAGEPRRPIEPMREEITANLAPGASASASCGRTRIGPSTLVCITASKSASEGVCRPSLRGPKTPALMITVSKISPSMGQASPDALAASATSSRSALAPSARIRCNPASSRAVATTAAPAARYCETNSRPRPREAPMMRMCMALIVARPRCARTGQGLFTLRQGVAKACPNGPI
jgi:hypothetical protein